MPKHKETDDFYAPGLARLPSGARANHIREFPIHGYVEVRACLLPPSCTLSASPRTLYTISGPTQVVHYLGPHASCPLSRVPRKLASTPRALKGGWLRTSLKVGTISDPTQVARRTGRHDQRSHANQPKAALRNDVWAPAFPEARRPTIS